MRVPTEKEKKKKPPRYGPKEGEYCEKLGRNILQKKENEVDEKEGANPRMHEWGEALLTSWRAFTKREEMALAGKIGVWKKGRKIFCERFLPLKRKNVVSKKSNVRRGRKTNLQVRCRFREKRKKKGVDPRERGLWEGGKEAE